MTYFTSDYVNCSEYQGIVQEQQFHIFSSAVKKIYNTGSGVITPNTTLSTYLKVFALKQIKGHYFKNCKELEI